VLGELVERLSPRCRVDVAAPALVRLHSVEEFIGRLLRTVREGLLYDGVFRITTGYGCSRSAFCEAFVLKRITLRSFKGFRSFNLTLNPDVSVLVGPNSAGKTTIVSAIRLCAALLDQARRRNPGDATAREAGKPRTHTIADVSIHNAAFNDENIYHDFLREEATIELAFTNGGLLRVEWPESDDPSPPRGFFSLTAPPGNRMRGIHLAKTSFPEIGVVPTLTPCEGRERLVTARTVRSNYTTRLASGRFRNQLWQTYLNDSEGPGQS